MTQKITIPQQNQPFRRQASLGGNVSFRELGGTQDNNSVVMAKVTKVYYKQGRVDFKLTNTVNNVVTEAGDGVGSAPIPIDFYGYQSDGKVFGHYRPIQVGDLVAVAYLWGHKEAPIILGVYPTQASSYEFVAPPDALDSADDRDKQARDYALADRKIYPNGNLEYQTGNGAYYKTLNGHSFMLIDDSPLYDQLWLQYKDIGAFKNSDNKLVEPLHESAGEWLLVHEDNSKAGDADNHRTRFYVKKDGTFQVLLSKSDHMDSLLLLQGSKDKGFTVEHLYDVPQKGVFDLEKGTKKNPDLDNAQQYVKFNLGGADRSASIEATTKDDSVEQTAKLSVRADGVYINDKLLVSSDPKFTGSTIIDDAVGNSQSLQDAIDQAQQGASQAQQAGDQAIAQAQSVSNEINDMQDNMATYLANSADNNTNIPNDPKKSNLWGKILNNVYLDGTNYTTKMVADVLDAGTLNGINMTVKNLKFSEGMGNHISANVIDTGTLRADVIDAKSISADKLNIKDLSDITSNAGTINQGTIQAGDDPTKGVVIDNLDADNPDKYTPSKKAFLLSEVQKLDSAADAAIDYGQSTGVDYTAVQKAQKLMDNGLAPLLSDLTTTTEFDHNNVIQLEQALQDALNAFHSASNSDIMAKIGKTANGKNTIYRGTNDPTTAMAGKKPNINDIWIKTQTDGTSSILVWDGKQWINPGLVDIDTVNQSLSNLPKSYYQPDEPVDDQLHKVQDGDTWYKLTKDSNGNYTYVVYKRESGSWVQLLDNGEVTNQSSIQKLNDNAIMKNTNYGGVIFDGNGVTLTSGNTHVYLNGTQGFQIQNGTSDVFHVDNSGNLTMQGNITGGDISGVNFTGDKLTLAGSMDVNGSISSANGNAVLSSQGLSIKDGGLYISDKEGHQTTYISDDGTLTTNKGVFTGTVHAEQLDLTGDDANIDVGGGAFHVDSNGHVTAYDFTSTRAKITGGTITGGSLSIGKMNNGNAIDPITTNTFNDQLSWQNIYQRQDPKQYTAIPATYWATAAGHTVTFKANYSVGNYLTTPIAINNDDLQFGFRVHFIDKDNKESDVDVPISTQDFYDNMTKTGMIIDAVQVPENTVQGSVYGYANIKAGSVTLGGVELSYTNPDYEALPDAFKVDPTGHVIANSIDVGPGGTITGSTITGGTINGATIKAGDTTDFFQTSKDNIYWITDNGDQSALIGKGRYVTFPGFNILDNQAIYLGTWPGASLENGTIVDNGGNMGHPKFNIELPTDSAFDLESEFGEGGVPLDNNRISGWVGRHEYFHLKQNNGFYVKLNEDNNASQFCIQKDDHFAAYFGVGDGGNQINLVTAGNGQGVNVTGDFHVTGSKNSIVNTKQGYLAINAYETAEYYFGDIGESNTGEACQVIIGIDQVFNETVNTDITYQVFVTPYSDTHVWVKERYNNRFVVCSDKPNAEFGWELKAKRKGYESNRLRRVNVDVNPLQLKGETK